MFVSVEEDSEEIDSNRNEWLLGISVWSLVPRWRGDADARVIAAASIVVSNMPFILSIVVCLRCDVV